MARKPTAKSTNVKPDANQFTAGAAKAAAKAAATGVAVTTPVRYTPIPKSVAARPAVTAELVARKAFELYAGGAAGGPVDHWLAAERLLRAA